MEINLDQLEAKHGNGDKIQHLMKEKRRLEIQITIDDK
jgi:hypothetical protein